MVVDGSPNHPLPNLLEPACMRPSLLTVAAHVGARHSRHVGLPAGEEASGGSVRREARTGGVGVGGVGGGPSGWGESTPSRRAEEAGAREAGRSQRLFPGECAIEGRDGNARVSGNPIASARGDGRARARRCPRAPRARRSVRAPRARRSARVPRGRRAGRGLRGRVRTGRVARARAEQRASE
jgi:hypothetical protein